MDTLTFPITLTADDRTALNSAIATEPPGELLSLLVRIALEADKTDDRRVQAIDAAVERHHKEFWDEYGNRDERTPANRTALYRLAKTRIVEQLETADIEAASFEEARTTYATMELSSWRQRTLAETIAPASPGELPEPQFYAPEENPDRDEPIPPNVVTRSDGTTARRLLCSGQCGNCGLGRDWTPCEHCGSYGI